MNIRDRHGLKSQAQDSLSYTDGAYRKLFFLHAAVTAGFTLLCALLSIVLNMGMDAFGGISGITARSLLETLQSLLETAGSLALPFWQIGLIFLTLQLLRKNNTTPRTLLEGFRQLGPVLRLNILKTLILFGVLIGSAYAATLLISFTPLVTVLLSGTESLPEVETEEELMRLMEDPAFAKQILTAVLPFLLTIFAAMLAIIIPVLYRLRMTDYVVMDHPEAGARNAIRTSWRMTKGNCVALFCLDLSFWWFYALELLLTGLYMLNTFLTLPLDPTLYYLICTILYCAGQVGLYTWLGPQVQTAYAAAYETLQAEYHRPEPIVLPAWEGSQS